MKRPYRCDRCEALAYAETGAINRARRLGRSLYCGRTCSAADRRVEKSDEQRRAEKAAYDAARRDQLGDALLAKKRAAYHSAVAADPVAMREKERQARQQRMPAHVEYCRRPEYRAVKQQYDRQRRAQMDFGPFADAALILRDIETEIASRASRYEIYSANGTLNKALKRKRAYVGSLVGREPEERAVGNPSGGEERQHAGGSGRRNRRAGSGNPADGQDAVAGLPTGEAQRADRDHRLRGEGLALARSHILEDRQHG